MLEETDPGSPAVPLPSLSESDSISGSAPVTLVNSAGSFQVCVCVCVCGFFK